MFKFLINVSSFQTNLKSFRKREKSHENTPFPPADQSMPLLNRNKNIIWLLSFQQLIAHFLLILSLFIFTLFMTFILRAFYAAHIYLNAFLWILFFLRYAWMQIIIIKYCRLLTFWLLLLFIMTMLMMMMMNIEAKKNLFRFYGLF